MKRILVTGATGNVGSEVIHYLTQMDAAAEVIAAVRNIEKAKKTFAENPALSFRTFDFEDQSCFNSAFKDLDILFLLRPPQISKVEEFFRPLLESAKSNGIKKLVFLSVQGAEKSKVIPHNKIEQLTRDLKFDYIFARPSYFMQNLTTTLLPEIQSQSRITLPAGEAKFNWIDVKNIGEASARLILDFEKHVNQAYEITGTENKSFSEVADLMSEVTRVPIRYRSMDPLSFYFLKRREGIPSGFAVVMTILHFLPRLQSAPVVSNNYEMLTGKAPTSLMEFLMRNKALFTDKEQ